MSNKSISNKKEVDKNDKHYSVAYIPFNFNLIYSENQNYKYMTKKTLQKSYLDIFQFQKMLQIFPVHF